jgi:hypothetical protein
MKKINTLYMIAIIISIGSVSCKKVDTICTGACNTVKLSGIVINQSLNAGLKNVEVKAHFYEWKSSCFFCFGKPLETFASTTTDNLGRFNFDIKIDTGIFKYGNHYALDVYTDLNNDYIRGNNISYNSFGEISQNIILSKYSKTKLTIAYKRDSSDIFSHYLSYQYINDNVNHFNVAVNNGENIFIKNYNPIINDTTIDVFTGANFFTKISGRKVVTSANIIVKEDSIFCGLNTINNIVIKY